MDAKEKESLKEVQYKTVRNHDTRKNETYSHALANSLEEVASTNKHLENKSVPFKQDIVIAVLNDFIESEEDNPKAKEFMKKAGKINSEESFGLPITVEDPKKFTNEQGKESILFNVVAHYSKDTDLDSVLHYLRK